MDLLAVSHESFIEATRLEIIDMAALLVGMDPDLQVPACPEWKLRDLVQHTGQVHRWATRIVQTGERQRWSDVELDLPASDGGLATWLAKGGDALIAALAAVDPETQVWTFAGEASVGWWSRRMLHETVIHRIDAQQAMGEMLGFIDPEIAFDGIVELLDSLIPATGGADKVRALNRVGDSLHLHALDGPAEWTITLTEDGYSWASEHTKATVAVRAYLQELLLLLWGRRKLHEGDHFEVFGDPYLFGAWSKATAF
jgi:uncharacterized protein (TIGR03083 family)